MISLIAKNWRYDNIDTVLFDKDGTLIDLHCFWGKMTEMRALEVIKRYNLSSNLFDKICMFLGYNLASKKMLADGITALYSRKKIIEIFRKNLAELGVNSSEIELVEIFDYVSTEFYKNIQEYTKPIDEAINLLYELKELGVKIGIVTSDSVEATNLNIKQFGWEALFDIVVGRETVNATKESGVPTKYALEKLGAEPQNTLMIGDAPMDYISAKNAGVDNVILVATGQLSCEELSKTSNQVLESLGDIKCLKI